MDLRVHEALPIICKAGGVTVALMVWNEKLSVNIKAIDRQHQKIVGIINELHDAMKERRGRDVMAGLLVELVDYSGYHFDTEEDFFRQYKYPGLLVHKSEHDLFKSRVEHMRSQFNGGNKLIVVEAMDFLKDWLSDHILVTDHKYSPFLNGKGVY